MDLLTTKQLKQKITDGENFVLDLFAPWCMPCKIMLNTLTQVNESLIKESVGEPNYKIYKFDIETDKEFVIEELGIRSVPTIKIFKDGKEIFSKAGVMSQNEILQLLN